MRRVGWMVVFVMGMSPAFADYRVMPGKPVNPSGLTSELKQAVPTLEGCDYAPSGTLSCRRLTGDFTDAEKSAMDAVVSVHDPDAGLKQKAQKQTAANAKLQAVGLTPQDLKDALGQ